MIPPILRSWAYPAFWGLLFIVHIPAAILADALLVWLPISNEVLLSLFMSFMMNKDSIATVLVLFILVQPLLILPVLWVYYVLRHYLPFLRNPRAVTLCVIVILLASALVWLTLYYQPQALKAALLGHWLAAVIPALPLARFLYRRPKEKGAA